MIIKKYFDSSNELIGFCNRNSIKKKDIVSINFVSSFFIPSEWILIWEKG